MAGMNSERHAPLQSCLRVQYSLFVCLFIAYPSLCSEKDCAAKPVLYRQCCINAHRHHGYQSGSISSLDSLALLWAGATGLSSNPRELAPVAETLKSKSIPSEIKIMLVRIRFDNATAMEQLNGYYFICQNGLAFWYCFLAESTQPSSSGNVWQNIAPGALREIDAKSDGMRLIWAELSDTTFFREETEDSEIISKSILLKGFAFAISGKNEPLPVICDLPVRVEKLCDCDSAFSSAVIVNFPDIRTVAVKPIKGQSPAADQKKWIGIHSLPADIFRHN